MSIFKSSRENFPNPILGLSQLELDLLLDISINQSKKFNKKNSLTCQSSFYWQESFLKTCNFVKSQISEQLHLLSPQFIGESNYFTHNNKTEKELEAKLPKIKRQYQRLKNTFIPDIKFSSKFKENRAWIINKQKQIIKYVFEKQKNYLETKNPFDLQPMTRKDIAQEINNSKNTAAKLIRNLVVDFPERIIFVRDLVPEIYLTQLKGIYALKQLQKDPLLFSRNANSGYWKVMDKELASILSNEFGLDVARRTVTKYRGLMNY